jgi:beta-1,4-mannosyltransferase
MTKVKLNYRISPRKHKQEKALSKISVLPFTIRIKGTYTDLLYSRLEKYNLKVIRIGSGWGLLKAIGMRSIFHIHWIEHKYTFGMANHFGRFSKFFVLLTLPIFLGFLRILSFMDISIVTTLHNIEPHRILFPRLEKVTFKIVLRMSKLIYVHTEESKNQAVTLYDLRADKFRVIPHGNWGHLSKLGLCSSDAREYLGISSSSVVLSFIGRISPDKGLHSLIDSLAKIKIDKPISLIVGGTPIDKKYLSDLIAKSQNLPTNINVIWYTFRLTDDFMSTLVNASDIGVLPYTKTSTPSSVLLFMSFAKPVVVPCFPQVKEFVGENYPFMYDGSTCDLTQVLEKAIKERVFLSEIGGELLKRASLFDWDSIAKSTYNDYLRLYLVGKQT